MPLSADDRFPALTQKRIDVLTRNTTWTLGREAGLSVEFPATTYFDGQGFMVRKSMKIESAFELADKKICVQTSTDHATQPRGFLPQQQDRLYRRDLPDRRRGAQRL